MSDARPIRLAVVVGEESGDLLAADLVRAIRARGRDVELMGVGGDRLQALGLKTLFDPHDIALMGFVAVVKKLPGLIRRLGATARAIVAAKPDLLLIVDSPDFTHRVAARVRASLPDLPIVDYVCPSVWAWRPQRAPAMKPFVDRVLCLLPFEPEALGRLGGPSGVFVGHRLLSDPGLIAARARQQARLKERQAPRRIVVLPGSRRQEIAGLMDVFGKTLGELASRIGPFEAVLPTLLRREAEVRRLAEHWPVAVKIVTGEEAKWKAFGEADAALAASGTVLLELALAGVPAVSCYRVDVLFRFLSRRMTLWSAALPNIISDRVVVPEYYNEMMRPGLLARKLEGLMADGPEREAAAAGYDEVRSRMTTDRPSGEIAADTILEMLGQ
jgi:lipid-A-disaccharide synthase